MASPGSIPCPGRPGTSSQLMLSLSSSSPAAIHATCFSLCGNNIIDAEYSTKCGKMQSFHSASDCKTKRMHQLFPNRCASSTRSSSSTGPALYVICTPTFHCEPGCIQGPSMHLVSRFIAPADYCIWKSSNRSYAIPVLSNFFIVVSPAICILSASEYLSTASPTPQAQGPLPERVLHTNLTTF